MPTVAPAPTSENAATAGTTTSGGEATANTATVADSPTKYAIFKENPDAAAAATTTTTAADQSSKETVESVEEGSPAISTDGAAPSAQPPAAEASPKPTKKKHTRRVKSRRLSFADEMDNGQLCTVSYHANLHYAKSNEPLKKKSGGSGGVNNGGGCCIIS